MWLVNTRNDWCQGPIPLKLDPFPCDLHPYKNNPAIPFHNENFPKDETVECEWDRLNWKGKRCTKEGIINLTTFVEPLPNIVEPIITILVDGLLWRAFSFFLFLFGFCLFSSVCGCKACSSHFQLHPITGASPFMISQLQPAGHTDSDTPL